MYDSLCQRLDQSCGQHHQTGLIKTVDIIAKEITFCYAVGMKIVVIFLQALGSLGFILYGMKLMSKVPAEAFTESSI